MNMDVGNEISNKIRSAIKAKLVELNAYVDEELPDYIMVMVANKKSQLQMAEDLGLFLGANTDKFTTWLHGLLLKLQSITSETSAALFGSGKSDQSAERSKEQVTSGEVSSKKKHSADESKSSKKRTSDEGSDDRKARKRRRSDPDRKSRTDDDETVKQIAARGNELETGFIAVDPVTSKAASTSEPDAVAEQDSSNSAPVSSNTGRHQLEENSRQILISENTEKPVDVTRKETEQGATQSMKPSHSVQGSSTTDIGDIQFGVEDDDLAELLLTENDELAEELEQETAVVLPVKQKNSLGKETPLIQISDEEVTSVSKSRGSSVISHDSRDNSPPRSSRPRAVASPIRQSGRRSALVRAVEPRPLELLTRKRRGPTSVVGSVSREEEEEEGYDPRNPAVGNVASIVKVTARKSSVPLKLQANKSLLLKAMTEAEKSVETQRRVAVTPVRPFLRTESRDTTRDAARDNIRDRDRERDRELRERERDRERERERERERDRDRGDRDRNYDRRGHASCSSRESRRHSPTARIAQTSLRQAISQSRSSRPSPPVYIPTRKVQPAPRVDRDSGGGVDSKVGIVSKSRRQAQEQRAWLDKDQDLAPPPRKAAKASMPIVNFVIEAEYSNKNGEADDRSNSPPLPPSSSMQQQRPQRVEVKREPVSPQKKPAYPTGRVLVDSPPPPLPPIPRGGGAEIDSRVVEYDPQTVPSPVNNDDDHDDDARSESGSHHSHQGVPALLEDMEQEEFLLDDVLELTESCTGLLEEDQRQPLLKDHKPPTTATTKDRTRFVVTLDGVDTDQYDTAMDTEVVDEDMDVDKLKAQALAAMVAAQQQAAQAQAQAAAASKDAVLMSPPKIQPMNINLKDSDEEGEAMEADESSNVTSPLTSSTHTPLKQAKMMERCKFWPACINGSACEYHHPTVQCKTFPTCKFGDKCLYIHPNCRFDSKCMRPDCPFTHSSPRSLPHAPPPPAFQGGPHLSSSSSSSYGMKPTFRAPAPAPALITPNMGGGPPQCRFFPKCTNMACPFFHPKPCRFGLNCKNRDRGCPFFHPILPTVDKLTWVASSASSAISKVTAPAQVQAVGGKEAKKAE